MAAALNPWAIPALIGVYVAAATGWIAVRRRALPGAWPLLALAVAVGWWCLLQAVSIHQEFLAGKVLAAKLQYLGVCATPAAWLLFAVGYTGRWRWLRGGYWALLVPEVATLLLAWTNERHGLIWERIELVPGAGFAAMDIQYGLWFRLHVFYAYALILAATALLGFHLAQSPHHRRRLVAALVAPLLPWAANVLYLSSALPHGTIDLTPSGLALGGMVLGWSLLRHDLLDLPVVTRSRILDTLRDAVVVVDRRARVVDMNRVAGETLEVAVGRPLDAALDAARRPGGAEPVLVERAGRSLEVSTSPMVGAMAGQGSVLVIRDVTERHRMDRELRRMRDELQEANARLVELANTDALLGVANRRHFMERVERELGRARRYRRPVGLALLDVDRFKHINDTHGHAAGDRVLKLVAAALHAETREVDVVGRIGGDELAVVLPESDVDGARVVAERVRNAVSVAVREAFGGGFTTTVSIGVAASAAGQERAEELLHAADVALYRAKQAGRNRIAGPPGPGDPLRLPRPA